MISIADNITILDQHNSLMCEKSHFKTSAELFLTSKDKQYVFKVDITNSINSITADSVTQSIETSVNVSSDNNSTMTAPDFVTCKLLEFK